jgi:hypothetical protein
LPVFRGDDANKSCIFIFSGRDVCAVTCSVMSSGAYRLPVMPSSYTVSQDSHPDALATATCALW